MMTLADAWRERGEAFSGEWQGDSRGAGISIICNRIEAPGGGPRLHRHPYPETFLVRLGTGLFIVGDETIQAGEGSILVVAAMTPHKFSNFGPGPLETIDIHESGRFVTEWLE